MKILLVEDNHKLAVDIETLLRDRKFIVVKVQTLSDASEKINCYDYDLVIVDLGLPDGSGLDLVAEIKQKRLNPGILIVTAKNTIEDKVKGLELGADDYITKPFHQAELIARVNAILRRFTPGKNNLFRFEEISVDLTNNQVTVKDEFLSLTRKEFDLLIYFMYNPNRLLTKENIAEHLWGDHIDQADSFDFVYNHIKNLRKKMTAAGCRDYIKARYGMGYIFGNSGDAE